MRQYLTDEQVAEVWALYRQGKSAAAIARHFNQAPATTSQSSRSIRWWDQQVAVSSSRTWTGSKAATMR